jgi:beta-glucosidase
MATRRKQGDPRRAPSTAPYLDPSNDVAVRAQDLIARLTLEEKVSQLWHAAPAIPRLGIPAYNWWNEALHGVGRNGRATIFPQAIGLAATWDPELVHTIAGAIGDEARAKYHAALRRNGSTGQYQGLTFWSPNINIFRDPRWGRGQETYGEDPFLTGELGAAFVRGLQGDHPVYLKVAACAKHYAVHSGPERDRHRFDARVSVKDLRETYLPAFRKLVTEAGVESVMGAYNRVNGEPCTANRVLLEDILRGEWGFRGHVVSDCWAIDDLHGGHGFTGDAIESVAVAIKRGCDLECGCLYDHAVRAIERGLLTEADVDRALARTLATRFRLGMFDPPSRVPYRKLPLRVVNSPAHRALAHRAAQESLVLLRNEAQTLPLGEDVKSVFITGPFAADQNVLLGNYNGMSESLTTLLEGIIARVPEGVSVNYRMGCMPTQPNANSMNYAVHEAASCDVIVACLGISPQIEGEEGEAIASPSLGDRDALELPAPQQDFLRKLIATGRRVVLVLCGGSPVALGEFAEQVHAILFVWYPGQEGGRAVGDVLFGVTSPSGRLPITFPRSVDQLPPFEEYGMAGRTYRYMTEEPLYPFGFGLSYTRFEYDGLTVRPNKAGARVSATVRNTGKVEADEVVQVYLTPPPRDVPLPKHYLVAFRRIRLRPGRSARVSFVLPREAFEHVNARGDFILEPGQFRVQVGGCSPGSRGLALGAPAPVKTYLTP